MKRGQAVPALLLALGLVVAARAEALPAPGKATIRAWLGYRTLALGDINGQIDQQRNTFRGDTLVEESTWDPFGSVPEASGELDVQVTTKLSTGLAVGVHRSSVRHQMLRVFSLDPDSGEPAETESLGEQETVRAWDVIGHVALWVPSAPGLHFGGELGLVRGTFERHEVYHLDVLTAFPDLRFTDATFRGTGVVLGAYTGYQQSLTPQLGLTTRIGYQFRQVRHPSGNTDVTDFGDNGNTREWETGPLVDGNDRPMRLDLGGFYFRVGLSATLGGE